jgi:hypothetical protein
MALASLGPGEEKRCFPRVARERGGGATMSGEAPRGDAS